MEEFTAQFAGNAVLLGIAVSAFVQFLKALPKKVRFFIFSSDKETQQARLKMTVFSLILICSSVVGWVNKMFTLESIDALLAFAGVAVMSSYAIYKAMIKQVFESLGDTFKM